MKSSQSGIVLINKRNVLIKNFLKELEMKMNLKLQRNELIPVFTTDQGNQVVDGRQLHSFLGIGKFYSNWAKDVIKKHNLVENRDYVVLTPDEIHTDGILAKNGEKSVAKNGKPNRKAHNRKEYIFRLAPAKKIAMGTNNEAGDRVKDYFLECERIAKATIKPIDPLATLSTHTHRPVQIKNSKAVNRHIWENDIDNASKSIGDYHREATKAVSGKTPSQLKKEAKAAGMPSKTRTSGREVLRHINPAAACALSLGDTLTKAGASLEDIKPVLQQSVGVYASIIKLGFTPNELAA